MSELLRSKASTSSARCHPTCSASPCSRPGLHASAKEADAAQALVKFITAPAAAAVIRKHGMEPG